MPRPRLFTDQQEAAALAWYRANQRRGALVELAGRHGISWTAMRGLLKRAEKRETTPDVSGETFGTELQP